MMLCRASRCLWGTACAARIADRSSKKQRQWSRVKSIYVFVPSLRVLCCPLLATEDILGGQINLSPFSDLCHCISK